MPLHALQSLITPPKYRYKKTEVMQCENISPVSIFRVMEIPILGTKQNHLEGLAVFGLEISWNRKKGPIAHGLSFSRQAILLLISPFAHSGFSASSRETEVKEQNCLL